MGDDVFSMCYAPSLESASPGPTGGHLTCDKATKFSVEVPQFCCKKPRIENESTNDKKLFATAETCGDTLAAFNSTTQQLKFERGPASTATFEELSELQDGGFGNKAPSPVALKAIREGKEWKPVIHTTCSGRLGTLIKWKDDPDGKAEFCPTGTPPVRGEGYASWFCDGAYTQENRIHCCKVNGRLRCVNHLVDRSTAAGCKCKGVGGAPEQPESVLPTESAMPWALAALGQPALSRSRRSVLRPPVCSRARPRQRGVTGSTFL